MKKTIIFSLGLTLALAACGGPPKPADNEETNFSEMGNVVSNDIEMVNEAPAAPVNMVEPTNRMAPPKLSDEQQIQEDAEASGMTSRLSDDAETKAGGAANNATHN